MNEDLLTKIRLLPQYYYEKGLELAQKGDLDGAGEQFITASSLQEDYLDPCRSAAEIMALKGMYREALYWYDKALALEPSNPGLAASRSSVLSNLESGRGKEERKTRPGLLVIGVIFLTLIAFYLGSLFSFSRPQPVSGELPDGAAPAPVLQEAPAEPVDSQIQEAVFIYIVKEGDTLSKIAKLEYGDSLLWTRIYEANRADIKNPHEINVGQKLIIPQS